MKRIIVISMAALAGCTQAQLAKFDLAHPKLVAAGQLFCAKATVDGPLVVALANSAGVPVIVTGALSTDVAYACGLINGIPTTPPADPAAAPVVAAPGPVNLPTAPATS